jgi:hypothetical protein
MNIIEKIMKATIYPIDRPEAYGLYHILFMIISLVIIITFCYLMRKNNDKTFRIVLISMGSFLILTEIYKQLYYLYAIGVDGYDWDILPFQLCSVPMYISVIAGCMKKCKVRDCILEYLVTIGFLGGIMAYVEPSGILHDDLFKLLHSSIWHAMLIWIALYILFTKNANFRIKDYTKALIILAGVVIVATTLNLVFKDKASVGFNMCYISPFRNTPLAVFKDFDVFFKNLLGDYPGRIISIIIYLIGVSLGGFVIYLVSYYLKKLASKKEGKILRKKQLS